MKLIDKAISRIRFAAEKFNPIAIVALFSGGHDSGTASLIANEAGATHTVHINTGIGIEQTRDYVREICSERNWNLSEYHAAENTYADGTPNPQIYSDLVRRYGFPGPSGHSLMYRKLKQRQLERFARDIGASSKKPILFVSGVRSDESARRKRNTRSIREDFINNEGREIFVNAIADFSKKDCADCMQFCGLKRNQVVDLIHKSGECLCGAYADEFEWEELKLWFPETASKIEELEREVADKFPWKWRDSGPPAWFLERNRGQTFLLDYDKSEKWEPLCHRCNLNQSNKLL